MSKKEIDIEGSVKGNGFTLAEVGEGKGIEAQRNPDIEKIAELEKFMNEKVTVIIARDSRPGALDPVPLNVNGINQYVVRGRPQKIRRKYIEVLARSKITDYDQGPPDHSKPENIQLTDITSVAYPFSVIDDNPKGREWLQAINDEKQ